MSTRRKVKRAMNTQPTRAEWEAKARRLAALYQDLDAKYRGVCAVNEEQRREIVRLTIALDAAITGMQVPGCGGADAPAAPAPDPAKPARKYPSGASKRRAKADREAAQALTDAPLTVAEFLEGAG